MHDRYEQASKCLYAAHYEEKNGPQKDINQPHKYQKGGIRAFGISSHQTKGFMCLICPQPHQHTS